jgi:hypothetical protein
MGDRAYVELTCHEADAALFERAGFLEEFRPGLPPGLVTMVDVEAPDGNITALQDLASKGIVFRGWHDAGGSYDGACFAGLDGRFFEVPRLSHRDLPCIEVHVDGTGDAHQFENAGAYLKAADAVARAFGLPSGEPIEEDVTRAGRSTC